LRKDLSGLRRDWSKGGVIIGDSREEARKKIKVDYFVWRS
jgi:hypothetical protein